MRKRAEFCGNRRALANPGRALGKRAGDMGLAADRFRRSDLARRFLNPARRFLNPARRFLNPARQFLDPARQSFNRLAAFGLLAASGLFAVPGLLAVPGLFAVSGPLAVPDFLTASDSPPPSALNPAFQTGGQSISKVRAVSLSTVMRTVIVLSGSSCSIFSGHSTRHRSPE